MRHVHPRRRFSRGSTEASQKSWVRFVKLIVDLIADPSSFRQTGRRDAGALDPAFRLGEIKARDRSDRSKSPKETSPAMRDELDRPGSSRADVVDHGAP